MNHCPGCCGCVAELPVNIIGPTRECPGVPLTETRRALEEEICALNKELNRLTALVAVGREMVNRFEHLLDFGDKHFKTYATGIGRIIVAKWRSLEGKG